MNETLLTTIAINPTDEARKHYGHSRLFEHKRQNELRAKVDYVSKCKRMVSEYLEHTEFDILVVTNQEHRFSDLGARVKTVYQDMSVAEFKHYNGFNEYLKLEALVKGYELGYAINYWVDADNGVEGWDQESWDRLCSMSTLR